MGQTHSKMWSRSIRTSVQKFQESAQSEGPFWPRGWVSITSSILSGDFILHLDENGLDGVIDIFSASNCYYLRCHFLRKLIGAFLWNTGQTGLVLVCLIFKSSCHISIPAPAVSVAIYENQYLWKSNLSFPCETEDLRHVCMTAAVYPNQDLPKLVPLLMPSEISLWLLGTEVSRVVTERHIGAHLAAYIWFGGYLWWWVNGGRRDVLRAIPARAG